MFSEQTQAAMTREVAKYPPDQKRSAVMACLTAVQQERGWLSTEIMDAVAARLEMRPIEVYEVASFYSLYDHAPVGRHKISVCTNVSCMLCGSDEVVAHLKRGLGIDFGETTSDGRFTLREVECLAVCGGAPAMMIDGEYFENLSAERIDEILDDLD